MERMNILRETWKQVNNANNHELLAMVSNTQLDERTQILISQKGDIAVLKELLKQEELHPEAMFYIAKRGNDEIFSLLLQEKKLLNAVNCIIAENANFDNALKLIETASTLSEQAQINIMDRDDPELTKALVKRKDLTPISKRHLAQFGSPEVISIFIQQDFVKDSLLEIIADRHEEDINKVLLQHKLPTSILNSVLNYCSKELLTDALEREDLSNQHLKQIAQKISPDYFDKVLNHRLLTSDIICTVVSRCTHAQLETICKRKHLDETVQEAIIKKLHARIHPKKGGQKQEPDTFNETDRDIVLSIMERDNLSTKAMLAIVKLGINEFIDILVVDDNLPPRVQNEISILRNNSYKEILLTRKRLAPQAQVNIARTRNAKFIHTLINREDLSKEAAIEIANIAFRNSDRFILGRKEASDRQEYIEALLNLEKLPEEVELKIVKTKNDRYILKLLSNKSLSEKTMSEIYNLKVPNYDRILASRHNYPNID